MKQNVVDYFLDLVQIDSESKKEKAVAEKLASDLQKMGAELTFDTAHQQTGGNVGNLYAYFPGELEKEPILFCAHMDTVVPGNGVKPQIKADRIVTDGSTVLGADDKSGIAEIIYGIKAIQDSGKPHAPIEALFTISEEIGLLGAKNLDYSLLQSKIGYALDSHKVGALTIGAPSQNSLKFIIHGKKSHAGAAPEEGVNAIQIAAEAICKMPMGRIDDETTCSIGIISGGSATNIVPDVVKIEGEVRSHNPEKLKEITQKMLNAVKETVTKYKLGDFQASAEIEVHTEYHAFRLAKDHPVVQLSDKACQAIGIEPQANIGGGGSDVNIFNKHGLEMAICGSGMENVHTVDEYILLDSLQIGTAWVAAVIRAHSK
ncbi:MAG: M20/M25/M40 family metallo-hydrolase [Candidatus Cloacimonadales bacterium]